MIHTISVVTASRRRAKMSPLELALNRAIEDVLEGTHPAYSQRDMDLWGCPRCGHRGGRSYSGTEGPAWYTWYCDECNTNVYVVAAEHVGRLPPMRLMGLSISIVETAHPRRGTYGRGRPRTAHSEF
ncbi:MAG: hypothetical protein Q7S89_02755 [bacterium]|nr:hypothetical protein [bacterium]